MHVSMSRDVVICPVCQLSQFEPGNGKCRRCHHSFITYIEFILPNQLDRFDSQWPKIEVGGLVRRLRSRRGMTQAALAALTGINRTYLSRTECGQVMPSVVALMRIACALGVDKILLRVHSSSN